MSHLAQILMQINLLCLRTSTLGLFSISFKRLRSRPFFRPQVQAIHSPPYFLGDRNPICLMPPCQPLEETASYHKSRSMMTILRENLWNLRPVPPRFETWPPKLTQAISLALAREIATSGRSSLTSQCPRKSAAPWALWTCLCPHWILNQCLMTCPPRS